MKRMVPLMLLLLLALTLTACERRSPVALGNEWEVYVVADDADWAVVEEQVRGILEKKLVTPQTETVFEVIRVRPQDFSKYLKMRNLMIISSLEPGTGTDRILRRALKDELYDRVVSKEEYLFVSRDQWASEQFIVVVAAPGREALKASLNAYPDYLFRLFDHNRDEDLKFAMFKRTNGRLEKSLRKRFGWTLKIPPYYELAEEDSAARLVHLRSPAPERHLLVHWLDHPKKKRLDERSLRSLVNRLGKHFYNAEVVQGYAYTSENRFTGRPAVELIGLWQSRDDARGGPLHVTSFYDPQSDRLFVLMRAVFAPRHRKEPYLRELRLMSETFSAGAFGKPARLTMRQ